MPVAEGYRITIRMSPEMGAWIDEQARLHELEAAAFVRMQLAQVRNGQTEASEKLLNPPWRGAVWPDDNRTGAGLTSIMQAGAEAIEPNPPTMSVPQPEDAHADEPAQPPPVDVDAIVYQTLAEADAKGLTRAKQQDEDDEDDDHIPGLPRTVMARGNWSEGGFRKTKEWANR